MSLFAGDMIILLEETLDSESINYYKWRCSARWPKVKYRNAWLSHRPTELNAKLENLLRKTKGLCNTGGLISSHMTAMEAAVS